MVNAHRNAAPRAIQSALSVKGEAFEMGYIHRNAPPLVIQSALSVKEGGL